MSMKREMDIRASGIDDLFSIGDAIVRFRDGMIDAISHAHEKGMIDDAARKELEMQTGRVTVSLLARDPLRNHSTMR